MKLHREEYPRPQLRRAEWQSLSGAWKVNGAGAYVPSCRQEEELLYEREFELHQVKPVVLLHFGAVDQICEVSLNGVFMGRHEGGYLPFSFDVSQAVKEGVNLLSVKVTDRLSHDLPYGKQTKTPGGMWYTAVSGIWQTVWLEQLPSKYISGIKITPDMKGADIEITGAGAEGAFALEAEIEADGRVFRTEGGRVRIEPARPQLWSPDDPYLYWIKLRAGEDECESYFALRTVSIEARGGIPRVCLNGRPVFLHGVLDQGYFSPGLFTPEDPAEYERDVMRMKELGFNMLRKHIKVEPEAFYYACDRLGMMVMQDMVQTGEYSFFKHGILGNLSIPHDDIKNAATGRKTAFTRHSEATVEHLFSHPCIIAWTVFNEGWGQFEADRHYELFKQWDPTRLVDSTSGWFRQKKSDFDSRHIYFRLADLTKRRAAAGSGRGALPLLVSECGGYTLDLGSAKKTYGYGKCRNSHELTDKIVKLYEKMIIPAIHSGCCGCVYTQLSDIEEEINGLYSYDRKTCKVEKDRLQAIAKKIADETARIG